MNSRRILYLIGFILLGLAGLTGFIIDMTSTSIFSLGGVWIFYMLLQIFLNISLIVNSIKGIIKCKSKNNDEYELFNEIPLNFGSIEIILGTIAITLGSIEIGTREGTLLIFSGICLVLFGVAGIVGKVLPSNNMLAKRILTWVCGGELLLSVFISIFKPDVGQIFYSLFLFAGLALLYISSFLLYTYKAIYKKYHKNISKTNYDTDFSDVDFRNESEEKNLNK